MTSRPHHALPIGVPPANRFTILVVDDESSLRAVICRSLDRIGYTTISVENPIEALSLLRSDEIQPDLIVSDVEMPQMNGIDMVSEIRQLNRAGSRLPIIVASGNPSSEMRRQAIAAGADLFLTKPFELSEFYGEIGRLLRESRNSSRNKTSRTDFSGITDANRLEIDSEIEKTI